LYCYRPLPGAFIATRRELLSALPEYAGTVRVLEGLGGLDAYLEARGEARPPEGAAEQAEAALLQFLEQVFAERSDFSFDLDRFTHAYEELERVAMEGHTETIVVAPLLGVALEPDSDEVPLGDGLSLTRGETFAGAPEEAVWGMSGTESAREPRVLAVQRYDHGHHQGSPAALARTRFRWVLSALRLFERGGYALGPLAYVRSDQGTWRPLVLGGAGRPRLLTLIPAAQEDELRAFYNLVTRRTPGGGELAWALSRFEMGLERLAPFEALSDYLLALRALLERVRSGTWPELDPDTSNAAAAELGNARSVLARTGQPPEHRRQLAERAAQAISLEHEVIHGAAPSQPGAARLIEEIADHLRGLLRDVICGHLDPDLCALADGLLEEAVTVGA